MGKTVVHRDAGMSLKAKHPLIKLITSIIIIIISVIIISCSVIIIHFYLFLKF